MKAINIILVLLLLVTGSMQPWAQQARTSPPAEEATGTPVPERSGTATVQGNRFDQDPHNI